MKKKLVLSAVSLTTLGLVACSPPSPQEIAKTTSDNTSALISEAGDSVQVVNGHSALKSLSNGMSAAQGGTCGTGTNPDCTTPSAPPKSSFEDSADRLGKLLKERLLVDKNLESKDWFSATFLIPGEDLCSDGTYTPSQTCVDQVNQMQVRIKAWPKSDGSNLELLIGKDRTQAFELQLGKTDIALITDLGSAKKVADQINALTNTSGTSTYKSPRVMEGKVEFRLHKNADHDFTMSQSVLADVRIESDDANGGTVTFQTQAQSPLIAFNVDAVHKRLAFSLDVGQTKVTFPYSYMYSKGTAGTKVTYLLSGASFNFSAEDGQNDFLVGHVALGSAQSFLDVDGNKILTADLNETSGRKFDLNLSRDTDGLPVIRFLPEFDLALGYFFKYIKADANPPSYLLDETYRIKISGGASPTIKPVPASSDGTFPGGLKVVSGSLTLSTTAAGVSPVTVSAGQCLVSKTADAGAHPILGSYAARACP